MRRSRGGARYGLGIVLVGGLGLSGCDGEVNEYDPPPLPTVTVARPVQQSVIEALLFTGTTLRATARVSLGPAATSHRRTYPRPDAATITSEWLACEVTSDPPKVTSAESALPSMPYERNSSSLLSATWVISIRTVDRY